MKREKVFVVLVDNFGGMGLVFGEIFWTKKQAKRYVSQLVRSELGPINSEIIEYEMDADRP